MKRAKGRFAVKQKWGEVHLVPGGRRAYLWCFAPDHNVATLSGPATLRRLARAILREVPAPKPRKR